MYNQTPANALGTIMSKRIYITGIAAVLATVLLAAAWIFRFAGLSSVESRLMPIAAFLSCAQEADFVAAGVSPRPDGHEFELSSGQLNVLVRRISSRLGMKSPFPSGRGVSGYRVFFSKVTTPETARLRTMGSGRPRPYFVLVFEVGPSGVLDRGKDASFLQ